MTSGMIELHGDTVLWHHDGDVLLHFQQSDIVVVGEYTNPDGPWLDDWFIVFVFRNGTWSPIS